MPPTPQPLEPLLVAVSDRAGGTLGAPLRLAASRCDRCSRTTFPALTSCPVCGGDVDEVELPSEGRIRGFTSVLAPPPDSLIAPPYHVGLVSFDDAGVTVMGLLTDLPPDVGGPVETVWFQVGEHLTYAFRPIKA